MAYANAILQRTANWYVPIESVNCTDGDNAASVGSRRRRGAAVQLYCIYAVFTNNGPVGHACQNQAQSHSQ